MEPYLFSINLDRWKVILVAIRHMKSMGGILQAFLRYFTAMSASKNPKWAYFKGPEALVFC